MDRREISITTTDAGEGLFNVDRGVIAHVGYDWL
jgi:hypothetical protein